MARVRLLSDLAIGDTVRTPSGRVAQVAGFPGGRALLEYADDGSEVTLAHHHLVLVAKANHAPLVRSRLVDTDFSRTK